MPMKDYGNSVFFGGNGERNRESEGVFESDEGEPNVPDMVRE